DDVENVESDNKSEGRSSIDTLELLKESSNFSEDKTGSNEIEEDPNDSETDTLNGNEEMENDNLSFQKVPQQQEPIFIEHKKLDDEFFKNLKNDDEIDTSDLNHLEPKLREAWIQMRKLDKKLALMIKKEKQVKRETIAFIEKNRAELELLRLTSDHKESKSEAENTAHFLALTNVDLDADPENDSESNLSYSNLTPIFKTQVFDQNDSIDGSRVGTPKTPKTADYFENLPSNSETSSNFTQSSKTKSSTKANSKSKLKNQKGAEKNFIQRNIKLAQDTGGVLAMTEEEKQRLNEILLDMDSVDAKNSNVSQLNQENVMIVEYNPRLVVLSDGDGFKPNQDELEKLKRINTALEKRNYSRSTISRVSGISQSQFSSYTVDQDAYHGLLGPESKQIKLNDDFDENEFGDKFIREARISREQEVRLKYLDAQLEKIKTINLETEPISAPETRPESLVSIVSEDQLRLLIDEYYTENSQNILENGDRELKKLETLVEENDNLAENEENQMPKINENLIKMLLDEAKHEGLYQIIESHRTQSVSNSEHSFYDEALEVLKERENILKNQNDEIQPSAEKDNFDYEDDKTSNENQTKDMDRISLRPSIMNSNQFLSEEKNLKGVLPPLINRNESAELNRDDTKSSINSTSSTNSSTYFPKISNRFLPK
ncbi:fibrous sheath-interacting 1, partial [Brachionus plicatilis]